MSAHNYLKFSAIILLIATIFSPIISLADQPKNPGVINISGSATSSQPTNMQYKLKMKKVISLWVFKKP